MRKTITLASLILASCLNVYLPKTGLRDSEGQEIVFAAKKNNSGGASATYSDNRPTVFYDPWYMAQFPEEFQNFIFHHEIGHIILGHISVEHKYVPENTYNQIQHEADCFSMRFLEEQLRYTSEQIEKVYGTAAKVFGEKRAEEMRSCLYP